MFIFYYSTSLKFESIFKKSNYYILPHFNENLTIKLKYLPNIRVVLDILPSFFYNLAKSNI